MSETLRALIAKIPHRWLAGEHNCVDDCERCAFEATLAEPTVIGKAAQQWPICRWCHTKLDNWLGQVVGKCPNCGAIDWMEPAAEPAREMPVATGFNDAEINTLLTGRFGVSSVTGLDDIEWLTGQLNKLLAVKLAVGKAANGAQLTSGQLIGVLHNYGVCIKAAGVERILTDLNGILRSQPAQTEQETK